MKRIIITILIFIVPILAEPITLEDAVNIAMEHNEQILIAREELTISRADANTALTGFFPRIKADGSYTRLDEAPSMTLPPEFGGFEMTLGDIEIYNLTLGAQQPLFTGGAIYNGYRAAKAMAKSQEDNLEYEENSLAVDVAEAFYGVVKAEAFKNASVEAKVQMEGHLEALEAMYREGLLSRNDLMKARVQFSNIELMLVQADNAVTLARLGLNMTLGIPLDTVLAIAPDTSNLGQKAQGFDSGIGVALDVRPDLSSMKYMLDAAKFGKQISWGSFAPSIVVIGNYSFDRPNQQYELEFEESWNVTLAASWNLISFGERIFKVKKSKAQYRQAKIGYDLAKRGVEMEIRAEHANLDEKRKALEIAQKKLEQSKESYRVAKAEFREGLATNTDVLDANTELASAKTGYVSALADLKIAYLKYNKAIGKELF